MNRNGDFDCGGRMARVLAAVSALTNDAEFYLPPVSSLSVSNLAAGNFQFNLTNAPGDGSVVIETSTNLLDWSPVVTNAADINSNSILCAFPVVGPAPRFFRANQVP